LSLLDLVAEDAFARGDLDEAGRLLDAAIATDPLEEQRYVRLSQALIAQGRSSRARRVLDHALAVAADLDVEPSAELRAVLAAVNAGG
jgi:DNA-binding SARP family transcriptional activator